MLFMELTGSNKYSEIQGKQTSNLVYLLQKIFEIIEMEE